MKRLVLVFLAATLLFSCQKEDEVRAPQKQDVVFSISNINFGSGLKSADIETPTAPPECPTDESGNLLEPAYASIWISDGLSAAVEYKPEVYRLDGNLYTQAIKLEAAEGAATTYTVEDFVLKDENGTVIMATPAAGSAYSEYVETTVDFTFDVNAFEKNEVAVDVLCYVPQDYDHFGFTWFSITEIAVREFCFFGDICLNGDPFTPADFEGSAYGTDLPVDVPAIMKIIVKRNGVEVPNSPFKNLNAQADGPLCVQYPDRLNIPGEEFTFEVYFWLPGENDEFSYQLYATYISTDDGALDIVDVGEDGVIDLVVGSCGYEGADDTFDFLYTPAFELTEASTQNSINESNGDKPWYSYEINGLCIEFTLHNPTSSPAFFDFQIDGDPGTYSATYSDILIEEGPLAGETVGNFYSNTQVPAGQTLVVTKCGSSEIKVGIHFGAEENWYLDWATFTAN